MKLRKSVTFGLGFVALFLIAAASVNARGMWCVRPSGLDPHAESMIQATF